MIEIIKNVINLIIDFINRLYNIEIDLHDTSLATNVGIEKVKLGTIVLAFIFFVFTIYCIFKMLGIGEYKESDND